MATYLELYGLAGSGGGAGDLFDKVVVACTIKAQALLDATPTADEVTWANNALENPRQVGQKLLRYVLAANAGLTTAQIQAATDAAIQSNVDAAVDALIAGGAL